MTGASTAYSLELDVKKQNAISNENKTSYLRRLIRLDFILIAISILFVILFWVWFFGFRTSINNFDKEVIRTKAIEEILAVCNSALLIEGVQGYFRSEDIRMKTAQPGVGVSAFVSMLEVSHDGLSCHWDGVNSAQLSFPPRQ